MLDGRSERSKNVPSRRGSLNFIHSFISFIFTPFICSYPLSFPHTHTLNQGTLENKLGHREAEKGLESCVCVCRHRRACKAICIWGSLCCVWTWVWDVCTHRVWVCLGTWWSGVLHAGGPAGGIPELLEGDSIISSRCVAVRERGLGPSGSSILQEKPGI